MNRKKAPTYLVITLAGLFLFALSMWRAFIPTPAASDAVIAQAEVAFGQVFILSEGRRIQLKTRADLRRMDEIVTENESEAILNLPGGAKVRVLQNSHLALDIDTPKTILIVKSGLVQDEVSDEALKTVIVSRDGRRRTLAEDQKGRIKMMGAIQAKAPTPRKSESKAARLLKAQPLSVETIQATMRNQRNLFFKCYGQLLQRSPGAVGEASLAFTIEQTGNVSAAEVANTSLQDPQFKRCLTEAIKRVEFKSFSGAPVQALFPIRFE